MNQKDVIYIDTEDDITSIIGKVKAAKEKTVALVPPKRPGVLQSAVNLRLLERTAEKSGKKLTLVTHNAALVSLAASAKIPVAKNLQSQPELAVVKNFDNGDEDIIDGRDMPVGDHAKLTIDDDEVKTPPTSIDGIDIEDKPASNAKKNGKKANKVPDFGSFRKKMAIGIAAGIAVVVFLVWAIWFAPHATITISAKTTPVDIKTSLKIGDTLPNNVAKATMTSISQTSKETSTIDVTPTGTKDVGTKASGTVVFNNCESVAPTSLTINAGTYISSGSNNYVVQATVVVPGGTGNFITGCTSSGTSAAVKVVATDIGSSYNVAAGTDFTVAGFSSKMTATSDAGITGGDKHSAKVVTATDVQNALNQQKQGDIDAQKKKLIAKFPNGTKIINDSFSATYGTPTVTPGIGEEVTGDKAKISIDVTYSLVGVAGSSVDAFLTETLNDQIDTDTQRIYDNGAKTAKLNNYELAADQKTATVQLVAKAQVGPKIDENKVKQEVAGKRAGEVIGNLKAIDGVSDVDVDLSPFWVASVPRDLDKITVQFKLSTGN